MNLNNRNYSDSKRQEVLSRILHGPDSFIHALEKDGSIINLPPLDGNNPTRAEDHLDVALIIDEIIDIAYSLVGKENAIRQNLPSRLNDLSIFQVIHANREYYDISNIHIRSFGIDPEVAADNVARRWNMASFTPSLMVVRYDALDAPTIHPAPALVKFGELLLGKNLEEEYDIDSFETLVLEITNSINSLFEKEGIEPTAKQRYNFISLAVGVDWHILRAPEMINLIGIEEKDFNAQNPTLVHLAANGINDVILKLCYANWIFPGNIEELEGLSMLPLQTLYHVWGIEWELPKAS